MAWGSGKDLNLLDTKNDGIVVRFKEMGRTLGRKTKEAHGFKENRLLLLVLFKCLSWFWMKQS